MQMPEERKEYLKRYKKEKLKRIPLEVKPEIYERLKAEATRWNMSVNGYIKKVLIFYLDKEDKRRQEAQNKPIS